MPRIKQAWIRPIDCIPDEWEFMWRIELSSPMGGTLSVFALRTESGKGQWMMVWKDLGILMPNRITFLQTSSDIFPWTKGEIK